MWTNKLCEGISDTRLEERQRPLPTEVRKIRAQEVGVNMEPLAPKLDLIRKLKRINLDYQKLRVSLTSSEVETFRQQCSRGETSFEYCMGKYEQYVRRLEDMADKAKERGLTAERNRIEANKAQALWEAVSK